MFRFTIRDVLWLTVVVGVACGWIGSNSRVGRLKQESHERWVAVHEVASRWAKERGEDVEFNIGDGAYGAHPNGNISIYSTGKYAVQS